MSITYHEYWTEISALRKALIEAAAEHITSCDEDAARDAMQARLHEDIDGHRWIIYTAYTPYVLIHSDNEDAAFDSRGQLETDSYSETMALMAFCAMEFDVEDGLYELLTEALELAGELGIAEDLLEETQETLEAAEDARDEEDSADNRLAVERARTCLHEATVLVGEYTYKLAAAYTAE